MRQVIFVPFSWKAVLGALVFTLLVAGCSQSSPAPPPGFSISVNPSSLDVPQGESRQVSLAIAPRNGFKGEVLLTLRDAPRGIALTPNSVQVSSERVLQVPLTLVVLSDVVAGTYLIKLEAWSGATYDTADLRIVVTPKENGPPSVPDFTISLDPKSLSMTQGQLGQLRLTVTPSGGFTGSLTLSLQGAPSGVTLSPDRLDVGSSPSTHTLTLQTQATTPPGTYPLTLIATSGSLTRTESFQLVVSQPSSDGQPRVWYYSPDGFQNGILAFQVPSPGQNLLLALAPNMIFSEAMQGGQGYWDTVFSVQVQHGGPSTTTPAPRSLPTPTTFSPEAWTSPHQAPPRPPEQRRLFKVDGVDTEGVLVYEGEKFLFYEEVSSSASTYPRCFTRDQYQAIEANTLPAYEKMIRLMGEPPDFDGNRKVIVYLSATVAERQGVGIAFFSASDISPSNPNRSEIVYFPCAQWSDAAYRVSTWFPRNIIHETIHLLQAAHAYRRGTPGAIYNSYIGFLSEGQAELFRLKRIGSDSAMGVDERWRGIRDCLMSVQPQGNLSLNNCYYTYGSLWHYWMHVRHGEGFEQRLIEAVYQSKEKPNASPHERVAGIPESLTLALTHLSLALDDTPAGVSLGLHFPEDGVLSLTGLSQIPAHSLQGGSLSLNLGYLESALVRLPTYQPGEVIRVSVDNPRGLYVVLVTW